MPSPVTDWSPCSLRFFQVARPFFISKRLFDRRFHVIVTAALVLGRNAGSIQFPSRHDMIATAAIVEGIFRSPASRLVSSTVCVPALLP